MWLEARTSCLLVWARPPPPSHHAHPQGTGAGDEDKQTLLPSSKGVLRAEQAGLRAGAGRQSCSQKPVVAACACRWFYGLSLCDNERKRAASAAGLLHGCSSSEIKGEARGELGDAAAQAAPCRMRIPHHAILPSQHHERGVTPAQPLVTSNWGPAACRALGEFQCMQHGRGWIYKWDLPVLLVGSPMGSEHPHCRGDMGTQGGPTQGSAPLSMGISALCRELSVGSGALAVPDQGGCIGPGLNPAPGSSKPTAEAWHRPRAGHTGTPQRQPAPGSPAQAANHIFAFLPGELYAFGQTLHRVAEQAQCRGTSFPGSHPSYKCPSAANPNRTSSYERPLSASTHSAGTTAPRAAPAQAASREFLFAPSLSGIASPAPSPLKVPCPPLQLKGGLAFLHIPACCWAQEPGSWLLPTSDLLSKERRWRRAGCSYRALLDTFPPSPNECPR